MGGKPLGKKVSSWKPSKENAQRQTSPQKPEPKPPSTPMKPKFPRKTRQAQDEKNRRGSGSCPSLNLTEAKAPKQEPRRPVKPAPRHLNRGETTGRSSRPGSTPEYLHKWKPPFQPGGSKSTLRKQGSQAETWGAGKRKPYNFQFHASLRVKTVTTGGTENGQKRRRHCRYDRAQGQAQEETRAEP